MQSTPAPTTDLAGKTYVITGSNTGIGRVTAIELARRGGRVLLACRSKEKTVEVLAEIREQCGDDVADFVPLDLASFSSVRACAKQIAEKTDRIDALINNAGLAGKRGLTQDGFEMTFGVNHLGHFLLTRQLLDLMKQSRPSRIVTVSSKTHHSTKRFELDKVQESTSSWTGLPEYCMSKLANILFTAELARRLEGTGVTTYAVHPGVIASDVWRRVPWPFRFIIKLFMISVEEGAQTSIHCAAAPDVAMETGLYYDECWPAKPSSLASNAELAAALWQKSEQWCAG